MVDLYRAPQCTFHKLVYQEILLSLAGTVKMLMWSPQITCLYDMDIPRPENFNETYLYEGATARHSCTPIISDSWQNSWNAILPPSSDPANP